MISKEQSGAYRPAVTGAGGVLGRILCERVQACGTTIARYDGDVRDAAHLRRWVETVRPTHLFHLAAKVPVDIVESDPVGAFEVNVLGTANVLNAVARTSPGCWTFVASTSHVYRSMPAPIRETDATAPQSTYGESKLAAECVAGYFLARVGLRVCIGRIFSFYHDTQRKPFLYPSILDRIASHNSGDEFELRGGDDVRDISNAEDIVRTILALKRAGTTGIVNVGSGQGTRIRDFVASLGKGALRIRVVQERAATSLVADLEHLHSVIRDA